MAWPAAPLLLGQLSLLPARLWGAGAQDGGFQLLQPEREVWVTAGQTLALTCTVSGSRPPGPVRWLKGWGSGNKTIYDQRGSFPRVTRVMSSSNTDFSIRIRDVQPEDAGTYYCVKFRRLDEGDEVFRYGEGTAVSLYESTPVPSVVAAAVVLCFLLLLSLSIALCMYRRKRRGEAESQGLAGPTAMGIPLRCCARTPGSPSSEVLDAETSHLPSQRSSKEEKEIHYADLQPLPAAHYADLQPLPAAPRHGRSAGAACSEYASIRVAAK